MTSVPAPKIVVEHYSLAYPDGTESLRDISLEISPNEITVLFGPAGGGKSTLLRALNRLNDMVDGVRVSGRILLDGRDLADTPPEKRPVHTVFQSYALFPHMTVGQNVAFGLEMKKAPRGEIKKRVDEALAREAFALAAAKLPLKTTFVVRQLGM